MSVVWPHVLRSLGVQSLKFLWFWVLRCSRNLRKLRARPAPQNQAGSETRPKASHEVMMLRLKFRARAFRDGHRKILRQTLAGLFMHAPDFETGAADGSLVPDSSEVGETLGSKQLVIEITRKQAPPIS